MAYTIKLYDPEGNVLADPVPNVQYISWERSINAPSTLSFELDIATARQLQRVLLALYTEVRVFRSPIASERAEGVEDDVLFWAGEIDQIAITPDDEAGFVVYDCVDWVSLLSDIQLQADLRIENTNEGQILQQAYETATNRPNADYGLLFGDNTSTKVRTREFKRGDDLLKIFQNMSKVREGVDFEILPDKTVLFYDLKQRDRSDELVLTFPGNLKTYKRVKSWREIINNANFEGDGVTTIEVNEQSQQRYRVKDDSQFVSDVSEQTTLDDKALETVLKYGSPISSYIIKVEPNGLPFGSYELGDVVRIQTDRDIETVNEDVKITGWSVRIDSEGVETTTLSITDAF